MLERDGHTEATVDLMRLAGLKECGLCCEIMREDGTMMRTTELMELAEEWNICFITIAAIIEYRKNMTGLWRVQQWQNSRQNMENLKRMAIRIF